MASEGILRLVPGVFADTGASPGTGVYASHALKPVVAPTSKQFVAVKQATDAFGVVENTSYDVPSMGILQNCPDDGEAAEVAEAGVTKALLGLGGCSVGSKLGVYNGTSGALIVATSGHYMVAVALEAGAAGDPVSVLLKFGKVV